MVFCLNLFGCCRLVGVLGLLLSSSTCSSFKPFSIFGLLVVSRTRTDHRRCFLRNKSIIPIQRLSSTSSSLSEPDEGIQNLNGKVSEAFDSQVWLDLRGTAFSPSEAVSLLRQILFEDDNIGGVDVDFDMTALVDRILLDEDGFFKVVSKENEEKHNPNESQNINLLYTTISGDLVASIQSNDVDESVVQMQSFPIGRVVNFEGGDGAMLDPMQALDTTSNGEWIVIDTSSGDEVSADNHPEQGSTTSLENQICSLMEFLSGATAIATQSLLSSPSSSSPPMDPVSTFGVGGRGGVAICCGSISALLHVDAALKKSALMSSSTGAISTTESGILLLPTTEAETSADSNSGSTTKIPTALLLPFDALIWKTVMELKQLDDKVDQ